MDERDHALGPAPRRPVDQLDAVVLEPPERAREVVHDVTHVVQRRLGVLGNEFRYTGLPVHRLEELDPLLVITKEHHTNMLVGDLADPFGRKAERVAKEGERLIDTRDRDGDVMQRTELHRRGGA